MSRNAGDYRPRDAQHALLHRVIDEHLDAFLRSLFVIVTYRKIYRVRRFTSPRSAGYFMTCRLRNVKPEVNEVNLDRADHEK
jgi:hypothetical protein